MRDDEMLIRQMAMEGLCCSQIIMAMGLKFKGEENPSMLAAAHGLCLGVHVQELCGILSAAAQVFALFDKKNAAEYMIPQLFEWFEDHYQKEFGGVTCEKITGGVTKMELCLELIINTWQMVRSTLEEFGFEATEN